MPAWAEDPVEAMVQQQIGALAPCVLLADPPVIETTGPGEPDIGLEGGGPALACRPVFSRDVVQVGPATADPEKDSVGHVVDRMECGPG